ncbi:MAG: branched-chain-amino-acid transaminase, partial [Planctomycetes bacterium]|nr:branched-chain-amino-acid transaminase [Planctomycetota bacterium]
MNEPLIYIDGQFFPKSDAKISVFDHGLLYGDGVFEGIRAYNGKVFLCKEHIDRLYEGAHCLCIEIPISKEEMEKALYETMAKNNLTDGYIRLVITRGVGDLGLSPRKCAKASVIIIAASITMYPEELYKNGMNIITVAVPRAHPETLNPRVKSLNYLSNILAKIEALNAGVEEAVMLNHQGFVSECTGDNIFIVKDGVLKTPPAYATILVGCTRNKVMELAKESGIAVEEPMMQRYDLYSADECFLTGTAAEVIPVVNIDGRKIGTGKPGPITQN